MNFGWNIENMWYISIGKSIDKTSLKFETYPLLGTMIISKISDFNQEINIKNLKQMTIFYSTTNHNHKK